MNHPHPVGAKYAGRHEFDADKDKDEALRETLQSALIDLPSDMVYFGTQLLTKPNGDDEWEWWVLLD